MDIGVLIADDDTGMRLVLKKVIEKVEGFRLVGEAEDGETALSLYESLQPEVVILDVEMPGISGVDCAKKITDINPMTIIIFATAHNEYMPEAFQVYAFDYIVKPFKIERVYQTLERVKALNIQHDLEQVEEVILKKNGLDKIMIRNKEGMSFVDMKDILLIQRENRNTVIYTKEGSFVTSDGLSELEERLDKALFFRSHKSYIINLSAMYKICPYGRWTYIIKLKHTDKDALLTHERYEVLKKTYDL